MSAARKSPAKPVPLEEQDRDALIALVRELRETVARQDALIARQAEALGASSTSAKPDRAKTNRPVLSPEGTTRIQPGPSAPGSPTTAMATKTGPFAIVFDGGSLGNPGQGYGSFHITAPTGVLAHEQLDFGDRVTNNQAEYRTLIAALERLAADLGGDLSETAVIVNGDSALVVNQVNGDWKVKHPDLAPLHRRAVELLGRFGKSDVRWHRRANSVKVLGH